MLNDFLNKLFGKDKSKDVAKKRLRLALIYDQIEVSEDTLIHLQQDIVSVISRYFVIEADAITLDIRRDKDTSALIVNTPILRAMRKQPGAV